MLFNSFPFLWLLIVTFVFYYTPKISKYQVQILIIASLIFYASDEPGLLLLLLGSVSINAFTSYYVVYGLPERRKRTATAGVTINLLLLAFFKYSPLFSTTFFDEKSSIGSFLLHIPLPIGISFYTFEGISLLVDVYKDDQYKSKELIPDRLSAHVHRTLCFISFFPHLVAGPIVKAHDFLPQITHKFFKDIEWNKAFENLVLGYFFKMVVADNLKDHTYWIAFPYFQVHSSISLITMLFGYSCQIFADFAGYSMIAVGLARLFGYHLIDNFNFPYIAASFKEFWKRWHISLSAFLMEYLYFPLGGNKKGKARTYLNLLITMFLGGLWHGAAWSYAIWGILHGLALAVERFFSDKIKIGSAGIALILKRILVFVFVTFAWLLFKLPEFNHVIKYIERMCTSFSLQVDAHLCAYIILYSSPVFLYHAYYLIKDKQVLYFSVKYKYVWYAVMLFLIMTNSGASGSFIYFQF
jgi:alginate O-acetyltransferase complex protein AlgI